jgi:hypothetical protein
MKFERRSLSSVLVGAFAVFCSVSSAQAISVSNRDDKDHKLTVIEGEAKVDHTLKASAILENICLNGCIIRLNDSDNDEYELEGTEVVSIEDGYLYYDGPEAAPETAPAPGTPPKPQ